MSGGLEAKLRRQVVRASRAYHRYRGPAPVGPPEPPACPANERIGPPDYVGIGAQKAGTTWWTALIEAHPDVHRVKGQPKELHFFDALWEKPWSAADATRYARYFPRPSSAITGEWTPGYMIDFWTPGLIAKAAPAAKILVLLRDPVDRFRSGLTHTDDATNAALTGRDAAGGFQRGLYAQQLRRVFDAFPREQVLILQYEACRDAPEAELRRTFDFLGLRQVDLSPSTFTREFNPTTGTKVTLTEGLRRALANGYAVDLAELKELLPDLDLARWPTAVEAGLA